MQTTALDIDKQLHKSILTELAKIGEAELNLSTEFLNNGKLEAGEVYASNMNDIARGLQKIEWLLDPRPRKWMNVNGNTWYWNKHGMSMRNFLTPKQKAKDLAANSRSLRPSMMTDCRELLLTEDEIKRNS